MQDWVHDPLNQSDSAMRLDDRRPDGDVRCPRRSAIRVQRGTNIAAISAGGSFECSHMMSLRRATYEFSRPGKGHSMAFCFLGEFWPGKAPAFDSSTLTSVERVTPGVCWMIFF